MVCLKYVRVGWGEFNGDTLNKNIANVFVLGLFSLTNNNKRTAKVYSTIKDLQNDIKKSYKIVILKSCIGYVIENNNNNNIKLINNKKQINQYRIHKIEEGKILKFEKFCAIETTKCDYFQIFSTHHTTLLCVQHIKPMRPIQLI